MNSVISNYVKDSFIFNPSLIYLNLYAKYESFK